MDSLAHANAFAAGGLTWEVIRWDGAQFVLAGGHTPEAAWGRHATLTFTEVSYVACPATLYEVHFRLGTADERRAIQSVVALDPQDEVVVLEAETSASAARRPFFVVAQRVVFARRA